MIDKISEFIQEKTSKSIEDSIPDFENQDIPDHVIFDNMVEFLMNFLNMDSEGVTSKFYL